MENDCYLSTGRLMNVNTYNLTVVGNDGIHDSVVSQVYLSFDKFEERAKQEAFLIHIGKKLEQSVLAKVFREISFHASTVGKVQILSVIEGKNKTDLGVLYK